MSFRHRLCVVRVAAFGFAFFLTGTLSSAAFAGDCIGCIVQEVSGKVGIGTTAPADLLEVYGSASGVDTRVASIVDPSQTAGHYVFEDLGQAISPNNAAQILFYYAGAGSTSNRFGLGFHGTSEYFSLLAGGKVGIGTTSPTYLLDAESSADNLFQVVGIGTGYGGTLLARIYSQRTVTGTDGLFQVGSAYAPNAFYVQDSGYVGIGTTSPATPLDVETANNRHIAITDLASNAQILAMTNNAAAYATMMIDGSSIVMNTSSGGNVGIGVSPTSYTLQVNGSVAGTSAYNNTSDARLKKDVSEISAGLDVIEKLRGIRFHWRKPEERMVGKDLNLPVDEAQVGFIAQEVQKVLPEAVTRGKDGIYTMQESKIVPILVEAMKEQEAQIEDDQKEIAALDHRNTDLAAQLATLQRQVSDLVYEHPH